MYNLKKIEAETLDKVYIWELEAYLSKYEKSVELSPFTGSAVTQWIRLTNTSCYLGGFRLWFICPDCSKRVGVLFVGEYGYSCRHCLNLTYKLRNENRRGKDYQFLRTFRKFAEAQELMEKIKRYSYSGIPTRKMRKIMQGYSEVGLL